MEWWIQVGVATGTFLDQHGLLAAFVLILIEEAGVPVPVPGDILMLLLGVRVRQGQVSVWQAILVPEAATIVGATLLYTVAARAGYGLVHRYGRFLHLSPTRLERAERWLRRHGPAAVLAGRLAPGLRIATALVCGVLAVPARQFVPAMSLGALLYISVYVGLGYWLGPVVLTVLEGLHLPLGLLGSLVPLIAVFVWTVRARRGLAALPPLGTQQTASREGLRAGAIAGGLATIGSLLLLNVLVHLAGGLAFLAPGSLFERTAAQLAGALARDVGPVVLALTVVAVLGVGVLWGALYGAWGERWVWPWLPDWGKGVGFAVLPWFSALFLVLPLLGGEPLGAPIQATVAGSETVRHLTYGALLGLIYPIFMADRAANLPSAVAIATPPATQRPADPSVMRTQAEDFGDH